MARQNILNISIQCINEFRKKNKIRLFTQKVSDFSGLQNNVHLQRFFLPKITEGTDEQTIGKC